MKRTATSLTLGISALFLAVVVGPAFAESRTNVEVSNNGEGSKTNVNVESNTGGNTICQNGKCTTTSNNGTSKVCVNGVCNTSEDGNVNYQSEDGNTKVNIKSNSDAAVSAESNGDQGVKLKKGEPTITPTVFKNVQGAKDELETIKKNVEEKVAKSEGFNILSFIQAELTEIREFFSFKFLFGKE